MNGARVITAVVAVALLGVALGGCKFPNVRVGDTGWLPGCVDDGEAATDPNGSIFDAQSSMANLVRDGRMYGTCDLLTVAIQESASGDQQGKTTGSRTTSTSASLGAMLGLVHQLGRDNPSMLLESGLDGGFGIAGGSTNSTDGGGNTVIKGALTGVLTVAVVDVLPNGLLEVEGGRELIVNNEVQVLWLHGYVDPAHVEPQDMVDSYRLHQGTIALLGRGSIADKQATPIVQRVVDQVWPM